MNSIVSSSIVLVLIGAGFMVAAIVLGGRARSDMPAELRNRWRVITALMIFFLSGYLLFVIILAGSFRFPTELITAPVFFAGALFVLIVIKLSRVTIQRMKRAERELLDVNEELKGRIAERTVLAERFDHMAADLERTTVSRDYVDSIIHSMADTLIVINPDGTIKTVNAALMTLLGQEEELVGKPLEAVLAEGAARADILVRALSKEGWISSAETLYVSRTGKRIPVLVSGASILDKDGTCRGFVLIGKDITERKKGEDRLYRYALELKESNNEIQNFSYIISHDLRAPLVSIKGFSSELAQACKEIETVIGRYLPNMDGKDRAHLELLLKQDINEALKFIASSADRMDGLINSILNLSRVGRRELNPEPVDMESLTRGIVDSLAHQIGEKNIRVTLGELPVITADRLAMQQVMGNLLDNAVKYFDAEKPGEFSITAEQTPEETVFHVRDNGRGIAAGDIPKVFEIFKRVGKQDKPGEGMGLAYVKALVKRHGGRIWCESEPGKGSVFSFTIAAGNEERN